ncbi:MAG: TadE/TadG family type IV pilus assembly protein [Pseudomonadota bacterium]
MRSFLKDRSGNVAMMFGLLLIPLLAAVGVAIDFHRQNFARTVVQQAVDATALRIAQTPDLVEPQLSQKAEEIFNASLDRRFSYTVNNFSAVRLSDGNVTISAVLDVKPIFLQVVGVGTLSVAQSSEVRLRKRRGLEMVIAFDTTASMGFGNTWQTALSTMSSVLTTLSGFTGDADFFISVVPFSDRVQVGTGRGAWLDASAPAGWNGCFEPREEIDGSYVWSLDDDTPSAAPFAASIPNVTGGLAGYNNGPRCPNVALTGPTSNVQDVIDAAAAFTQGGTGRFDVALAWSWRLLSPKWSGFWGPADYPAATADDARKVAVFVTDGRTEAYTHELSTMRSWGYNQGSIDGFENLTYICERMKDDGIEIFMFRINGNPHAESYMLDCASSPDHYQAVSNNEELAAAFGGLLEQLDNLQIYR